MLKTYVHIFNAILTVSFGMGAYLFPREAFAPFGFVLDDVGVMVTKGYAATTIGYGLAFWFTRHVSDLVLARNLLLASAVFNGLEALLQGPVALAGWLRHRSGLPLWRTVCCVCYPWCACSDCAR